MLHSTIIHELRVKYELTVSEYCILDAIQFLSTNPKSPVAGWCSGSKSYIANSIGVSKTFVITTIEKLVELELVEKHMDGRLVRITEKWFNEIGRQKTDGKQSDLDGKQSDPNRLTKIPPTDTLIEPLIDNNTPPQMGKNKKKTIEERELDFKAALIPYVNEYGKEMVRAFFDYWTEKDDDCNKMKFEKEKAKRGVFEIKKRLSTWHKNQSKFGSTNKQQAPQNLTPIFRKEGTDNQHILDQLYSKANQ